jgi:3-deoxy-manno-octulosonate cytidylyltransferase (CMP-KDO synthetase)
MKTVALIPSRWASTRFPGKPLALIAGKPMIQRVYERSALIPGIDGVFVATDSEKIAECAKSFGGSFVMTQASHPSGSDRLAEAAGILGLADDDIVINVQGDQPGLNPSQPGLLAAALKEAGAPPMSTLAVPFLSLEEARDPNRVKVAADLKGGALYFSRSLIPYFQSGGPRYFKHIGLYAYRAGFLREFASLPRGPLERAESLEQLRALENGFSIKVVFSEGFTPEVDVPEDILRAEEALAREGARGPGPAAGG